MNDIPYLVEFEEVDAELQTFEVAATGSIDALAQVTRVLGRVPDEHSRCGLVAYPAATRPSTKSLDETSWKTEIRSLSPTTTGFDRRVEMAVSWSTTTASSTRSATA